MINQIQESLTYIKNNLATDINIDDLANTVGVSKYHFLRLFNKHVGYSPKAYITKCRLETIIYEVQEGSILKDTVFFYGFDTISGFYKAFKRYYGCTPREYLEIYQVSKPSIVDLREENTKMITKKNIINVLGNWDILIDSALIEEANYSHKEEQNITIKLNDGLILKIGRNIFGARTHIKVCEKLNEVGVNAPVTIKTKNNDSLFVEGNRFYMLYKQVEGEIIADTANFPFNYDSFAKLVGKSLAKLHKVLQTVEDEDIKVADISKTSLDWALPNAKLVMQQWKFPVNNSCFDDTADFISKNFENLPRQVIHRDPNPFNMVIASDNISFIDFEISEVNSRLFDLCYTCTGLLVEFARKGDYVEEWIKCTNAIISSYNNESKLSEVESQSIVPMMIAIQSIVIAYLKDKDHLKELLITNCKLVEVIWNNKEKIRFIN